jgi:hypothetical protein
MRAGWLSYIQQAYPDCVGSAAGPALGQETLVVPVLMQQCLKWGLRLVQSTAFCNQRILVPIAVSTVSLKTIQIILKHD